MATSLRTVKSTLYPGSLKHRSTPVLLGIRPYDAQRRGAPRNAREFEADHHATLRQRAHVQAIRGDGAVVVVAAAAAARSLLQLLGVINRSPSSTPPFAAAALARRRGSSHSSPLCDNPVGERRHHCLPVANKSSDDVPSFLATSFSARPRFPFSVFINLMCDAQELAGIGWMILPWSTDGLQSGESGVRHPVGCGRS